ADPSKRSKAAQKRSLSLLSRCMNWRALAGFALVAILWGSAWILAPMLPLSELLAGARPTLEVIAGAVLIAGAIFWLMRPGSGSGMVTLQITRSIQSRPEASDSKQG
ncbi:MAG: hypothetical protein WA602_00450, partial [Silvibacterium sp.]